MSPTYGSVTKLFIESEFQHKQINKRKKCEFSAKSCSLLGGTDSEIKLFKHYTEKNKKKFLQNCHHSDRNLPVNQAVI